MPKSTPKSSYNQLSLFDDLQSLRNDDRPLPELIAEQYQFPLAYHDVEGKRYYAVQDWIKGIAQTDNPRSFWSEMKRRLKKAEIELSTPCLQLPYRASNGKTYKVDHAQEIALYQIVQRMDANTGLRNIILVYLADSGVKLDEFRRDPDKAVAAAVSEYKRKGKDDLWIASRIQGVQDRKAFTDALVQHVVDLIPNLHFAEATNLVSRGLWGRDVRTLKEQMGLKQTQNLRDLQNRWAIHYTGIVEATVAHYLGEEQSVSWDRAREIIFQVAKLIGVQAEELGKQMGIDLATGQKLLT